MMVAGEYEVVLYKWSDLLGFRETTKVSSPRLVERANLFWHHDVMYLYVSTAAEKDSAVTTLYKAHVFGK